MNKKDEGQINSQLSFSKVDEKDFQTALCGCKQQRFIKVSWEMQETLEAPGPKLSLALPLSLPSAPHFLLLALRYLRLPVLCPPPTARLVLCFRERGLHLITLASGRFLNQFDIRASGTSAPRLTRPVSQLPKP